MRTILISLPILFIVAKKERKKERKKKERAAWQLCIFYAVYLLIM